MRALYSAFLTTLLILEAGCVHPTALPLRAQQEYRVFFPSIRMASNGGERISSFECVMSCGRFRALQRIPDDWSVEVVSPVSEETKLRASAGHGSSTLWSIHDLDGLMTILVAEPDCFDIRLSVFSETTDKMHEHIFTKANLLLKR